MNLLFIGIGIGHEKELIIGYRYRFKFLVLEIFRRPFQRNYVLREVRDAYRRTGEHLCL